MEQSNLRSALLVMDMQLMILSRLSDAPALLVNVKRAMDHARQNKIPVIYVQVGFRPGAPEISVNNKAFSATRTNMANADINEMMRIHPDLAPGKNDIVVTKRRYSAFTGSDLAVVLSALNIRHLILTGLSTSGVVLSTLREAADKDFGLTVLSDGCADPDEEVHRVLTQKVFPRQADVFSIEEWTKK